MNKRREWRGKGEVKETRQDEEEDKMETRKMREKNWKVESNERTEDDYEENKKWEVKEISKDEEKKMRTRKMDKNKWWKAWSDERTNDPNEEKKNGK